MSPKTGGRGAIGECARPSAKSPPRRAHSTCGRPTEIEPTRIADRIMDDRSRLRASRVRSLARPFCNDRRRSEVQWGARAGVLLHSPEAQAGAQSRVGSAQSPGSPLGMAKFAAQTCSAWHFGASRVSETRATKREARLPGGTYGEIIQSKARLGRRGQAASWLAGAC